MTFTPEEVRLVLLTHTLNDVLWERTQLKFPRVVAQAAQHVLFQGEQEGIPAAALEEALFAQVYRMAQCAPIGYAAAIAWADNNESDWVSAFIARASTHSAANGLGVYQGMLETFDAFLTHLGV